jgi:ABC-2 type transport system ATP-binding protein
LVNNLKVGNKQIDCTEDSIIVEGISKHFGKIQALDNVSLRVGEGIVFALLGPNGSGKTTLIRILTTLLIPDGGTTLVGGFDIRKNASSIRPIIGLAGQYPAVDEDLTGKENLEMIGYLYHLGTLKSRTRAGELLETFELADAGNRRVKTYSGGMRRRLDLAATLVAEPSILFLDEPTTGLDPRSRFGLWDVIGNLKKDCHTVFLTTQYLEEADRLADKIAIMESGKIIRVGTPKELKECCGGETRVKMKLVEPGKTPEAVKLLAELAREGANSNAETGDISIPASNGPYILAEVVRRLDVGGIQLAELGLTQPTLDDVFLAITGHPTENLTDIDPKSTKSSSKRDKAK